MESKMTKQKLPDKIERPKCPVCGGLMFLAFPGHLVWFCGKDNWKDGAYVYDNYVESGDHYVKTKTD
jgi:ssDNA-binding Zn-finger/Zn-ribbon topoisomerase 1